MQYGLGLDLQPGRLGAQHQHARRLGGDDRRLPDRVARERARHPDHLWPRQRARPGAGRGRHRVPAQRRPGRDRRPRVRRAGRARHRATNRRASAPTSRSRPSSRSRATSAGAGPTRRTPRRPTSCRRWASRWSTGLQFPTGGTKISILANVKHYLGDGGTAMGVTGGPVTGDEAALRALHLAPYQRGGRRARRLGDAVLQHLAGRRDAHQQADDHRRAQGRARLRRLRRAPTTTVASRSA